MTHSFDPVIDYAKRLIATNDILVARREGEVFRVVAGAGIGARLVGKAIPPGLGLLGRRPSARVVCVAEYSKHEKALPSLVRAGARAVAVAPIVVGGQLRGCVCALQRTAVAFPAGDRGSLQRVAALAATLLEAEERGSRHLDRMQRIARELFGAHDLDTTVKRVVRLARHLAPSAGVTIALRDEKGNERRALRVAPRGRVGTRRASFPLMFGDEQVGTLTASAATSDELDAIGDLARMSATAVAHARLIGRIEAGAERALRSTHEAERLAAERTEILEKIPSGVVVADAGGRLLFVNEAGRRLAGTPPDLGRPLTTLASTYAVRDAHTGRPVRRREMLLTRALAGRRGERAEYRVRPSGATEDRWVSVSATPLRDAEGRPAGALFLVTDVTAERKFIRQVSESAERLRASYDAMACGVIVRDANGVVTEANPAVDRILGVPASQLIGHRLPLVDLDLRREDGSSLPLGDAPSDRALRAAGPVRGSVLSIRRPDGQRRSLHVDVVPVFDADHHMVSVVSSFIDITERKRAEDELNARSAQQESLIALGQLAIAGTPFAELVERAAAVVARSLDVPFAKVLELLPDGETCVVTAGVGWPKGVIGTSVPVTQTGECELALRTGAPVIVEDVATERRFTPAALVVASGVRSSLCVAIEGRDRPLGTIDVHATEPRRFGDADARYLQAVANVLASAGRRELDERARLERSLVLGSLTAREREVLRLLVEGRNNREIAEVLGIQYSTVRGHVRAIIEKLGVRSKLQAVARANAIGLLPDS